MTPECVPGKRHHWRIEEPHDGLRMLPGVCRLCGAERLHRAGESWGTTYREEKGTITGIGALRDQEKAKRGY